jgi:hypothetical protein
MAIQVTLHDGGSALYTGAARATFAVEGGVLTVSAPGLGTISAFAAGHWAYVVGDDVTIEPAAGDDR